MKVATTFPFQLGLLNVCVRYCKATAKSIPIKSNAVKEKTLIKSIGCLYSKTPFFFPSVYCEVHLRCSHTWKTTRMQRIMQVSPFTIAFSIMSQMLLRWWASMGCCLPKKLVMGRLLLAASRLSWWIHMAPTWCSNWLITSFVVVASPRRRKSHSSAVYKHWLQHWHLLLTCNVSSSSPLNSGHPPTW